MTIKLKDEWVWDSWYAHDGEKWHGYFLKAPKSIGDPELRHWNVTQGHAVSNDLIKWEYLGTCFEPSKSDAWDDYTTWTGSVVKGSSNDWHLFYTGTSRSEDGLYQRIGHAISDDLHNWKRIGDGLCLDLIGPNAEIYENQHKKGFWHDRAMRDPWVMQNPSGDGWLMYFTARISDNTDPMQCGAIGLATSPDLYAWTLQKPVFSGGFGQLEVPQVFSKNDRWYCLFCTFKDHYSNQQVYHHENKPTTGTHYLISKDPLGPWEVAPGRFFDGDDPCHRYAARIVETGNELKILGFRDVEADGSFGGYVMDPDQVQIDGNGLLHIEQKY